MHVIKEQLDNNKKMFWAAFMLVVLFAGLYVYNINRTVWNVVGRSSAEKEIASLKNDISNLEFEYIALQSNITPDEAYARGFVEATSIKFVARKADVKLAVNNEI